MASSIKMRRPMRTARHVGTAAMVGVAPLVLAACGSSPSSPGAGKAKTGGQAVATLTVARSAQVFQAVSTPGAHSGEGTFTVTAVDKSGKPVVGAPVRFFIGPMVALSGIPPKAWYPATGSGRKYVGSVSHRTNGVGQASITLLGQTNGVVQRGDPQADRAGVVGAEVEVPEAVLPVGLDGFLRVVIHVGAPWSVSTMTLVTLPRDARDGQEGVCRDIRPPIGHRRN